MNKLKRELRYMRNFKNVSSIIEDQNNHTSFYNVNLMSQNQCQIRYYMKH